MRIVETKVQTAGFTVSVRSLTLLTTLLLGSMQPAVAATADADALLKAAFDNWRAESSVTDIAMTVHRKNWERSMEMIAYTRGNDVALVRFTAPAKDAGNATLKTNDGTWIFNPKLNQVIKLPASMMAQSWMGSDFSYNDLAKADDVLTDYTHSITDTTDGGGHQIYTIEALPKAGAPVVWGKLVLTVRDDGVLLGEAYFDQDMQLVRKMTTDKVGNVGGRVYPVLMTMRDAGEQEKWTRIETTSAKFNVTQPSYLFTLSNLRNPRN